MSKTLFETSHGPVIVSDEDYEALKSYQYRLMLISSLKMAGTRPAVGRSAGPKGKQTAYLARDVAERMGLDLTRVIRFRSGNQLDCRRENLYEGHENMLPGVFRIQPRQPERVHRHSVTGTRQGSVPEGYWLSRHEQPCQCPATTEPGSRRGCVYQAEGEVIGTAVRLYGGGWEFARPNSRHRHSRTFRRFTDGAAWLAELAEAAAA